MNLYFNLPVSLRRAENTRKQYKTLIERRI